MSDMAVSARRALYLLTLSLLLSLSSAVAKGPKGIHLSLGADPATERIIQWASNLPTDQHYNVTVSRRLSGVPGAQMTVAHPQVDYLKQPLMSTANFRWIERARIWNLVPGATYDYRVGGQSEPAYTFDVWTNKTQLGKRQSPMTFLFYGSFENDDGEKPSADTAIKERALFHGYNAVVNLGALSCQKRVPMKGNSLLTYLHSLRHVAGTVVYLTTPGKKERDDEYSMYSMLYSMPDVPWPMTRYWYSFNTEFAHIVSFTSTLYFPEMDTINISRQLEWLRNDLKMANDLRTGLPDSRPWIIAYSHDSLYCSGHVQCIENSKRMEEIEEILHEYGVDLVISSQHDVYERTWPVYKGEVKGDYVNPRGPVHVTTAAFTCPADKGAFGDINNATGPKWSAFKHSLFNQSTFGVLYIYNRTHLLWKESLADSKQSEVDHFYLVQTRHGAFHLPASTVRATTVILGLVIVILVVLISAFLYLRFKAFLRRRAADRKMSYVNLTSSLEL